MITLISQFLLLLCNMAPFEPWQTVLTLCLICLTDSELSLGVSPGCRTVHLLCSLLSLVMVIKRMQSAYGLCQKHLRTTEVERALSFTNLSLEMRQRHSHILTHLLLQQQEITLPPFGFTSTSLHPFSFWKAPYIHILRVSPQWNVNFICAVKGQKASQAQWQ